MTLQDDASSTVNVTGTNGKIDTPLARRRSSSVRGYVYFVRAGDAIKIGFSTNTPSRLAHMQTSNPERLEFLGSMRGTKDDERKVQGRFWPHRVRGEWFHATEELVDFIREKARIDTRPAPSPETMAVIQDLTRQRFGYGGKTPIGQRYSNLIEQTKNYEFSEGEQRKHLSRSIAWTVRDIAELKACSTN